MVEKSEKTRLIKKTSQNFLWISIILMILSSIALFFYVKYLLRDEVEEELFSTMARVETVLSDSNTEFSFAPVIDVLRVNAIEPTILKDTIIYDPSQKEMEQFRELTVFKEINQKKYKISVRNLVIETENILGAIVLSYSLIIVLAFIILFYFSKARNKKIWSPFFKNLEAIKSFSIASDNPILLVDSDILEFYELNTEIKTLTSKVSSDYKNLKQYTEDVSHELQTPLAIIQAKIENIINGDNLNNIQFKHLTSIQKDIQRLTNMNKRLTLLTKIENNQFLNVEKINMKDHIAEATKNFHELSNTEIKVLGNTDIWVKMDSYLAEALCYNLITNAIKHEANVGTIEIKIKDKTCSISNSGNKPIAHPENLYTRFYRESKTAKSTGLGLAIVKRICDLYGFQINYHFNQNRHTFSVTFQ